MPAGTYAVVRYIPDPARDEPINIGIIATGPAGAAFATDSAALERMRLLDPYVDPDSIAHIQEYLARLMDESVITVSASGVTEVQPWQPEFLQAVASRLPERFTLGRSLYIEYADESHDALTAAAKDLADRLVKPATRPARFPRDAGAPFEQLKRHFRDAIKHGLIRERPALQGATHRVRHPDFSYTASDGTLVVIVTVKLSQRLEHVVSTTADAKAFELYDLMQRRSENPVRAIAVVEQPAEPTEAFAEAVRSIKFVASETVNANEGLQELAETAKREAVLV